MADIAVTAAKVGRVQPGNDVVNDFIAGEALTAGQSVYINSADGKVYKTAGGVAGTAQFRGIALKTVGAEQAVSVLQRGRVYGFDLSGMDYDAEAYVSNTAGALADATGTVTAIAGRVVGLTDFGITKVLEIDVTQNVADWS
jgi:hypothetical protein